MPPLNRELAGYIYRQPSGISIDNSIEAKTTRLLAKIVIPAGSTVKSERYYVLQGQVIIDFWDDYFYLGSGVYKKKDLEKL